jgi:hypothetical protein
LLLHQKTPYSEISSKYRLKPLRAPAEIKGSKQEPSEKQMNQLQRHPSFFGLANRAAHWGLRVVAGFNRLYNVGFRFAGRVIIGNLRPVELWASNPEKLDSWPRNAVGAPLRNGGEGALTQFSNRPGTSKAINDQVCNRVMCFRHDHI